jgi:predicted membrane-bound mannosyltransferase
MALALFALAVRLPQLGERPMHTDESINAYIIGQLLAGHAFHYDPQDRHGPALAAVTLPLVKLAGAKDFSSLTESQLRLSPVLAGTATVLLLGAGVEMFGFVACLVAALLFAFAPLPVYYNRYFIHESLFVAATLGLILSGWRTVRYQSVLYAALAGF